MHFNRETDIIIFVSFLLYIGFFVNLVNLVIANYQYTGIRRVKFAIYNISNLIAFVVLLLISIYGITVYSYGIYYFSEEYVRLYLLFTIASRLFLIKSLKDQNKDNKARIVVHSIKVALIVLFLPIFNPIFDFKARKVLYYSICFILLDENISLCVRLAFNIKNNITFVSLIEAFDKVETGAVFAKMNGKIVMINTYAQNFFKKLNRGRITSIKELYAILNRGNHEFDFENLDYEKGSSIIRFKDGYSYKLIRRRIVVKKREYEELGIYEVSSLDKMIKRLRAKNEELENMNIELAKMIDGIDQITLETETLNLRHKVHDIIGQRLSIIVAATQETEMLGKSSASEEQLYGLLNNMIYDLKSEHMGQFEDRLTHLVESFRVIGADLIISGDLIQDEDLNEAIISIYRETTTNAIRHGNASKVFMNIIDEGDRYIISIWDNGRTKVKEVIEGTGLKGIRRSVEKIGGEVEFLMDDFFTIRIEVEKPQE